MLSKLAAGDNVGVGFSSKGTDKFLLGGKQSRPKKTQTSTQKKASGAKDDKGTGKVNSSGSKKTNVDDFNAETATNKQKGNFGEIKSEDNLLNNQNIKDAGYDLKVIGRDVPSTIDDKIVKGIDGLYENTNTKSNVKYVIDESKFGSSQLGKNIKMDHKCRMIG